MLLGLLLGEIQPVVHALGALEPPSSQVCFGQAGGLHFHEVWPVGSVAGMDYCISHESDEGRSLH